MQESDNSRIITVIYSAPITVRHLAGLRAGQYVLCEVIQAFNHFLVQEANMNNPKTVYILDHAFMEKLLGSREHQLDGYDHAAVARWFKSRLNKINIFDYKFVIVPINIGAMHTNPRTQQKEWKGHHWLGIAIDILNETIWYYDSMHNNDLMRKYTKAILWFVEDQLKSIRGKQYLPAEILRWKMKTKTSPKQGHDAQRQAADNNCASHLLLNTKLIIRGVPLEYSQEYATTFRYNIAHTIIEYHQLLQQQMNTIDLTEEGNEQPSIPQNQHQHLLYSNSSDIGSSISSSSDDNYGSSLNHTLPPQGGSQEYSNSSDIGSSISSSSDNYGSSLHHIQPPQGGPREYNNSSDIGSSISSSSSDNYGSCLNHTLPPQGGSQEYSNSSDIGSSINSRSDNYGSCPNHTLPPQGGSQAHSNSSDIGSSISSSSDNYGSCLNQTLPPQGGSRTYSNSSDIGSSSSSSSDNYGSSFHHIQPPQGGPQEYSNSSDIGSSISSSSDNYGSSTHQHSARQPTKPIIKARKKYFDLLDGAESDPQHPHTAAQPTDSLAPGSEGSRDNDIFTPSHMKPD
jgi:hypothetical protein